MAERSPFLDLLAERRQLVLEVAGVDGVARLDDQDVGLVLRSRAVLHASRHDEELALVQHDVSVSELEREPPFEYEEELVRLVVLVPDELALDLSDVDLVVVQVRDDLGRERPVEGCELRSEVYLAVRVRRTGAV